MPTICMTAKFEYFITEKNHDLNHGDAHDQNFYGNQQYLNVLLNET